MPKVSRNKVSPVVGDALLAQLAVAFANLDNKNEVLELLDSLITKTERMMFMKRLAIAVLLERGVPYQRISRILKVSPVTVGFVKNNIMKGNRAYADLVKKLDVLSFRIEKEGVA